MAHYSCAHGQCKTDYRTCDRWAIFPKFSFDAVRTRRWIELMNRPDLTVENATPKRIQNLYVCELHFPENVDLNYRYCHLLSKYDLYVPGLRKDSNVWGKGGWMSQCFLKVTIL